MRHNSFPPNEPTSRTTALLVLTAMLLAALAWPGCRTQDLNQGWGWNAERPATPMKTFSHAVHRGVFERDVQPTKVDQQSQMLDVRLAVLAVVVVASCRAREPARTLVEADRVRRHPDLSREFADPHGRKQTLKWLRCQGVSSTSFNS